jgi:hypothetical protein
VVHTALLTKSPVLCHITAVESQQFFVVCKYSAHAYVRHSLYVGTNASEEVFASTFKDTGRKVGRVDILEKVSAYIFTVVVKLMEYLEEAGSNILRNFCTYMPIHTVPYPI